ncbi:MAG: hypothetical protein GY851_00530 [bacterium]|nr:hypothetical protein [bacterium]
MDTKLETLHAYETVNGIVFSLGEVSLLLGGNTSHVLRDDSARVTKATIHTNGGKRRCWVATPSGVEGILTRSCAPNAEGALLFWQTVVRPCLPQGEDAADPSPEDEQKATVLCEWAVAGVDGSTLECLHQYENADGTLLFSLAEVARLLGRRRGIVHYMNQILMDSNFEVSRTVIHTAGGKQECCMTSREGVEHILTRSRNASAAHRWWQTVVPPCLLDPLGQQPTPGGVDPSGQGLLLPETDEAPPFVERRKRLREEEVEIAERWVALDERRAALENQRATQAINVVQEALELFRSLDGEEKVFFKDYLLGSLSSSCFLPPEDASEPCPTGLASGQPFGLATGGPRSLSPSEGGQPERAPFAIAVQTQ